MFGRRESDPVDPTASNAWDVDIRNHPVGIYAVTDVTDLVFSNRTGSEGNSSSDTNTQRIVSDYTGLYCNMCDSNFSVTVPSSWSILITVVLYSVESAED